MNKYSKYYYIITKELNNNMKGERNMKETMKTLMGDKVLRKVISWLMILAMVFGLTPADFSLVAKAATATVKVYFEKPDSWTTPVIHVWNESAIIDGDGTATVWGKEKSKLYEEEATGLYYAEVTNPDWTGFQFVNAETEAEYKFDDAAVLKAFNSLTTGSSVYYLADETGTYAWYTDAEGKNALPLETIELKEEYYLVGSIVSTGWDEKATTSQLSKNDDETYSITLEAVAAGTYEFKVLQDPVNYAWKYAWGGEGSGGNYVLTLEKTSDVVISINPSDNTYKASVKVKGEETTPGTPTTPDKPTTPDTPTTPDKPIENVFSPVYDSEAKTITFNLVTKATAAGIKGSFISAWQVTEEMTATDYGFTKTFKAPEEPGVYDYGMVSGESGSNWEADPLNATKITNGNPVIVANPVADNGKVSIYYPSAEAFTGKVLYKIKGAAGEYAEAEFKAAKGYDNLYVVEISGKEPGEYEYLVQVGDAEAAADPYNFTGKNTFTLTKYVEEPEYKALVLDEENGTVTFNYWNPSAKEVILAGSMNDWKNTAENAMEKNEETGLFTKTLTLSFGAYQYKYVVDGNWIMDPKNEEYIGENSSFTFGSIEPQVDGETGTVIFTYYPKDYASIVEETKNVDLMGLEGVTYVAEDGTTTACDWVTGLPMKENEDGTFSITIKNVPAGQYDYKFKANGGTWLKDNRNPNGSDNSVLTVPGVVADGDNIAGSGTYKFGTKVLGDAKSADEGSAKFSLVEAKTGFTMEEDGTLTVDDSAKTGYFKVRLDYTVDGEEKASTCQYYYTENAVIYEYEYKGNEQYKGQTDVYTWNNAASGTSFKLRNVGTEENPKYATYITLDDNIESFGYIIRLYGAWGDGDREFSDRTVYVNQGERYTKYKGGDGIAQPYVCASGKTCYDNGILFKYRDDQKFHDGTMDTIKEVKVVVNDKTYDMVYSEDDELFTYHMTDMETGDYNYYFMVDGKKVEDQYNKEGTMRYVKNDATNVLVNCLSTLYSSETNSVVANYDQNPVVEFVVNNSVTGEKIELSKIEADLSPVANGISSKVQFSTLTNKGILYIDREVKAGDYKIPVTLVDNYGNTINSIIPLTVVEKETTDTSWDEARVYFIVTDRFNDGDPSNNGTLETGYAPEKAESYHGGDLKGITEKLSYLQELGINTIWITPIVDNVDWIVNEDMTQTGYHGYWAQDFTKLDEHLGTTKDLDTLLDEAHKHGIKVMVDIVVNHSGYARKDGTGLENFDGMLRTGDEIGSDFLHGGSNSDLPDFKTEDPEVRAKLIAWQTAWASHTTANGNSIDYFRVDTVKHVEHETWSQLKTALAEVNPYFKMIGEFYGASYNNTGDYLGNGEMDAELDFDFKSVAGNLVNGSIDSAEESLEIRNGELTSSVTMGQFLSSHDENGFLYSQGYDMAKAKVAAALQMTAKGIPVIYYGEEIGFSGPNAFGEFNNNRYDMKFDNLTEEQQAMLDHYKKLLSAREMYSETFATGSRTKVAGGDAEGYLVFKRGSGEKAVYVALNTTDEAKTVSFEVAGIKAESMTDIYAGTAVQMVDNVVEITIPANKDGGTVILAKGKELSAIEVVVPTKVEYMVGDKLDLSNLSVTGVYGDAKIALSKDSYVVDSSAVDTTKAGTYTVKITAGKFETSFEIVVKAQPTAIPTAEPTKVPTKVPTVTSVPAQKEYKITYVMNKGTNNKSNPTSYKTSDVTLKNPTRKGYTFAGWYTDSNYKTKVTTVKASTKKDVTLYAKWTKVKVAKAKIKTAKNSSSKKIKLTLKKISGVNGYEIRYSTDKKFKKSVKKVTSKKTTKTITKLKKGKTYYIKVRAYKLDSKGKKVYGKYSAVKKVAVTK